MRRGVDHISPAPSHQLVINEFFNILATVSPRKNHPTTYLFRISRSISWLHFQSHFKDTLHMAAYLMAGLAEYHGDVNALSQRQSSLALTLSASPPYTQGELFSPLNRVIARHTSPPRAPLTPPFLLRNKTSEISISFSLFISRQSSNQKLSSRPFH